ncbi:hypothetical protein AXG93_1762s1120 [Marchantia polymorpha subsp. ruderalis]|nr:hypothetical protein AXG93_1762s1120 [Marchantia polymorpha subsp. ruderalis]
MSRWRVLPTLLNRGRNFAARGRMKSSAVDSEAGRADSGAVRQQLEAAAREDRLDFMTAAKILFSSPAKPKKFGLDFHLWQFFAACLPPFAVYLTAQYARHEIRRLEKEREQTEKLLLQSVVAEEVASRMAEGNKPAFEKSEERAPLSQNVPGNMEGSNSTSDDSAVHITGKDLQAMKTRLEVLEKKLSMLEGVRKGTEAVTPSTSQSGLVMTPKDSSPSLSTKHDVHQSIIKSADLESEHKRKALT